MSILGGTSMVSGSGKLGLARLAALSAVLSTAAVCVPKADAAAAAAAADSSSTDTTSLEEVIVTARRRSESIQDTPVSVS